MLKLVVFITILVLSVCVIAFSVLGKPPNQYRSGVSSVHSRPQPTNLVVDPPPTNWPGIR